MAVGSYISNMEDLDIHHLFQRMAAGRRTFSKFIIRQNQEELKFLPVKLLVSNHGSGIEI